MAQSNTSKVNPSDVTWDAPPSINPSEVSWDAPAAASPSAVDTVGRVAGLTTRAAGPYALAMGAGAAAGAPFGGIGAVPGAMAGAAALGITDLASLGYNALISAPFGYPRLPSGSETIQDLMARGNIGVAPATPGEKIYASGVEAAMGAASQANALRQLAPLAKGVATRNFMTEMGKDIPTQTAAATAAAVAPAAIESVTKEDSWLRDPVPMTITSLLAGAVGVKGATGVKNVLERKLTPSTDAFRAKARAAYAVVDNAGVKFTPSSYDNFLTNLQTTLKDEGFNPDAHSQVTSWVNKMERARQSGASLTELDSMRSEMSKNLGGKTDENTRRLAGIMTDEIDNYVANATSADVSQGDIRVAADALEQARKYWTTISKSQRIEKLIARAELKQGDPVKAIRAEFESFVRSDKKMRGFSPDERAVLKDVAKGKDLITRAAQVGNALKIDSALSLPLSIGGGYAATRGADPFMTALAGLGYLGTGAMLRGSAKGLTNLQAQDAARFMRGYKPTFTPINSLISPVGQETAQTLYNAFSPQGAQQ